MPSPTAETCRARAAEAERLAEDATLDNVRERNLRARDSWLEMAERAERTQKMRERIEAEKAAKKDAADIAAAEAPDATNER